MPHPLLAVNPDYRALHVSIGGSRVRSGFIKISEVYSMDWRGAGHFWGGKTPRIWRAKISTSDVNLILLHVLEKTNYSAAIQSSPVLLYTTQTEAGSALSRTAPTRLPTEIVTHRRADSVFGRPAGNPSHWASKRLHQRDGVAIHGACPSSTPPCR